MQAETFLAAVLQRMQEQKTLADKTFAQLSAQQMLQTPADGSNSIAIIVQHMCGNMHSRWTNFLTEDGEKPGRNRDAEFEPVSYSKQELLQLWEKGWALFLDALRSLTAADLNKTIYIRSQALSVIDAIIRQVAHYSHHCGQIVFLGKALVGTNFQSLSIPKGASQQFNQNIGHI